MKRLSLLSGACLLFLQGVACAEPAVDYSGSWRLDDTRSEPMEPIFLLQGLSWIQRQAAEGFDKQAEITQLPDRLTVRFDNLTGTHTQELFFDGEPHATVNPAGVATVFTTSWSDDGAALVAVGQFSLDDGSSCTLTEHRTLSADLSRMNVQVTMRCGEAPAASALRAYLRT